MALVGEPAGHRNLGERRFRGRYQLAGMLDAFSPQELAYRGGKIAAEFSREVNPVNSGSARDLRQAHLPQKVRFQILPRDVQPSRDDGDVIRARMAGAFR